MGGIQWTINVLTVSCIMYVHAQLCYIVRSRKITVNSLNFFYGYVVSTDYYYNHYYHRNIIKNIN